MLAALGGGRDAYRGMLLVYAGFCALWVPLSMWVFPRRALRLGQVSTGEQMQHERNPGMLARIRALAQFVGICEAPMSPFIWGALLCRPAAA